MTALVHAAPTVLLVAIAVVWVLHKTGWINGGDS